MCAHVLSLPQFGPWQHQGLRGMRITYYFQCMTGCRTGADADRLWSLEVSDCRTRSLILSFIIAILGEVAKSNQLQRLSSLGRDWTKQKRVTTKARSVSELQALLFP